MPQNEEILRQLRALVDAGAPQRPAVSGPRFGSIEANTGIRRLNRPLPDVEPLSEPNLTGLLNRSPLGLAGDITNPLEMTDGPLGAMSLPARVGKKALPAIAPEAYSHVDADGLRLYSRLTDAMAKAPERMAPAKVRSIAGSGASKEEITLRKLEEFLSGIPENVQVERDAVMKHLEANPLKLNVSRRSISSSEGDIHFAQQDLDQIRHELDTRYGPNWQGPDTQFLNDAHRPTVTPEEWERYTAAEANLTNLGRSTEDTARYDYMQTPGQKENYGESLINLPRNERTLDEMVDMWKADALSGRLGTYSPEELAKYESIYRSGDFSNELQRAYQNPTFESSHWDEPNNLVWSRHNDRTLNRHPQSVEELEKYSPDGLDFLKQNYPDNTLEEAIYRGNTVPSKGRFIEEIQSDWHQQGREKGYRVPEWDTLRQDYNKKWHDFRSRVNELNRKYGLLPEGDDLGAKYSLLTDGRAFPESESLIQQFEDAGRTEKLWNSQRNAVLDAPYKETYPDLALKQQLLDTANDPSLEWLGVADADTAQMMEGHIDYLGKPFGRNKGMDLFYNEKYPSALKKLITPFGGKVEYDNLPGSTVQHPTQLLSHDPFPNQASYAHIGGERYSPIVSARSETALRGAAREIKRGQEIPGPGMWKVKLDPEMKELIKTRGFPAMVALMALMKQRSGAEQ